MLRRVTDMQGSLTVHAVDGDIAQLEQFYFDDDDWAVRYLVLDTTKWGGLGKVLLKPVSVRRVDWQSRSLAVELTKEEVRNSASTEAHRPVSRQRDGELRWDWPYCGGAGLWGLGYQPAALMSGRAIENMRRRVRSEQATDECHLRSSLEVIGYHIQAIGGDVGHVEDFIVDDRTWTIQNLLINTRKWLRGKNVLISTQKIERVDWSEAKVYVTLSSRAIKEVAEFNELLVIH